MAEMLSVDELVAIGDSSVRVPRAELEGRDMPHCGMSDLQQMIYRHMHDDARAAVAKIRAALVQAGWRPGR